MDSVSYRALIFTLGLIGLNLQLIMIASLLKFGTAKNILDSFENEYLYFSPLIGFRSFERDSFGMFDPREGNLKIVQGNQLTITIEGKAYQLHHMFKEFNCQYQEYPTKIPGNICSLYMLEMQGSEDTFTFDGRLFRDEGKALLIYDVPRFYNSIDESLLAADLGYTRKKVVYYNPKTQNGELSFFHKNEFFKFQNEYRILLKTSGDSAIRIPIPNLKEYAKVIEFDQLRSGLTIVCS